MLEKFLKELNEILNANNMKGVEKILEEYTEKYYEYIKQGKREFEVMLLLGEPDTVAEFYISNGIFPTEKDIKELEKDRTIRRDEFEFDSDIKNIQKVDGQVVNEYCDNFFDCEERDKPNLQGISVEKNEYKEIDFDQPKIVDIPSFIKKESDYLTFILRKESCVCDDIQLTNDRLRYEIESTHRNEIANSARTDARWSNDNERSGKMFFKSNASIETHQPSADSVDVPRIVSQTISERSETQYGTRLFESKLNENKLNENKNIKENRFILENEREGNADIDNENLLNIESEKKLKENKFYINKTKMPTKSDILFTDIFMFVMCLIVSVGAIALFVVSMFIGAVGGMYTVASWIKFEGIKMQVWGFVLSLIAIAITALFAFILIVLVKSMIKSIKKHIVDKKEILNLINSKI